MEDRGASGVFLSIVLLWDPEPCEGLGDALGMGSGKRKVPRMTPKWPGLQNRGLCQLLN